MSNLSDEDIRLAAELRDWLIKTITDKQEELERLKSQLRLIDILLKTSSFKTALNISSDYGKTLPNQIEQIKDEYIPHKDIKQVTESKEIKDLRRPKDNLLLANVEVFSDFINIIPDPSLQFNINTPPFKSFFINRILEGMRMTDQEKFTKGEIEKSSLFNYSINEENGLISKIIVHNYRERSRLNEIFNTAAWVLSRMLEKSSR